MTTLHERSVNHADRTNAALGMLFDRLGSLDHPNGWLLRAYRNALRALDGNLDNLAQVTDVLAGLRETMESEGEGLFDDALALGYDQANDDLALYGHDNVVRRSAMASLAAVGLAAFLATIDKQITAIRVVVAGGISSPAEILGSNSRVGLLSPGPALIEARRWAATTTSNTWAQTITQSLSKPDQNGIIQTTVYKRQAVAAIDGRTTECCLKVHGKSTGLEEDFPLEGKPWESARLHGFTARKPPFHWHCRSALALVRVQDTNDALTRLMQAAAKVEEDARARTGRREEIWPSNAGSYRPSERENIRQAARDIGNNL